MRNILILLFVVAATCNGYSQEVKTLSLKSSIKEVTVFPSGAQVNRYGKIRIGTGNTRLILKGLAYSIDPNSIQVKGNGKFILTGVNHRLDYLNKTKRTVKIDSLSQLIDKAKGEINLSRASAEVLQEELALLNANRQLGGTEGTDLNVLKAAVTYYRTELSRIKKAQLQETETQQKLQLQINDWQRELNQLNAQRDLPTSEIEISLNSSSGGDISLQLSYYIRQAGWTPQYDLRVKDIKNPINLTYKALVYQQSGNDWKDVKLTFSSANPNQNGNIPVLNPWYLNIIQAQPFAKRDMQMQKSLASGMAMESKAAPMEVSAEDEMLFEEVVMSSAVVESQTSFQYIVPMPYSVPSSQERTTIDLNMYELPAEFEYEVIPKLDKDAFLMAKVFDWEQYALLAGAVNLYFEDGFVGKSYLNPQTAEDTLKLSLGRDQGIVVSRTKIDQYTSKKTLGSNKIESRGYAIELRNKKGSDINIIVYDQVPVSVNHEIEVREIKTGGGNYNEQTGQLKWAFTVKSQESEKLEFRYEVKYPKKSRVILE